MRPVAMRDVDEASLAWALIDVVTPQLNVLERNLAFVAVGAGDTFTAIRQILKLIAVKHIPLRSHLVQLCTIWLDAYTMHADYALLRRLIEGVPSPDAILASTALSGLATTPKPRAFDPRRADPPVTGAREVVNGERKSFIGRCSGPPGGHAVCGPEASVAGGGT